MFSQHRPVFKNYVKPEFKNLPAPNAFKYQPLRSARGDKSCMPQLEPAPIYSLGTKQKF